MNDITVARMESADIPAVEAIARDCFTEAWTVEGFRSELTSSHAIPLVARRAGEVVGFLCAAVVYDEGTINLIAARRDCRGQGIASAMLDELFAQGRERGAAFFTLEVRESNQTAIRFYQKHGFEPVGRRRNFYTQPCEDALLYTVRFPAEGGTD